MKKPPHNDGSNAGVAILALIAIAALGQCLSPTRGQSTQDVCGGSGSHPVTIGGAMVIGCK